MARSLAVLLTILLLLVCAPALAEEGFPVYCLYSGTRPVGMGVLFGAQDTLLTVGDAAMLADRAQDTEGNEVAVELIGTAERGRPALLLLEQSADREPMRIAARMVEDGQYCIGVTPAGESVIEKAEQLVPTRLNGHGAIYFTITSELLPGAFLADENGFVSGLVAARYGEGNVRYAAYTNEGLYFALMDMPAPEPEAEGEELISSEPGDPWLSDFSVSISDGMMTVDWSDAELPELADDSVFSVVIQDLGNVFYSLFTTKPGVTDVTLPVVHDRTYAVWVLHTHGEELPDNLFSDRAFRIAGGETIQPFDQFGFANDQLYLCFAPADTEPGDTELIPAPEAITAGMLTDPDTLVYLQVISRYEVTDVSELPMLVQVLTPDGQSVCTPGAFIFDPAYMEEDVWHICVDKAFGTCLSMSGSGELIPGTYTVTLFLGGMQAGTLTFALE